MIEQIARAVARLGGIVDLADAERLGQRDVGRECVDLAAAAGRGDVAAGNEHPRPLDLAGVDRIAQRDIGQPAIDADIAHRGEAAEARPRGWRRP